MTTKYTAYSERGGGGSATFILLAFSAAFLVALLGLTSVLAPHARAQAADQKAVGPTNPDNGFPFWYQDSTGLRLDLCLEQNGLCLTEEPDPTQPISFPDNFGGEAFWWQAETATDNAILVLASEAAFANEEPADGDQVAFGRIRIRVDNLTPGSDYRVIHPYGEEIYENVPGGVRGINDTQDIGCFDTPCATFDRALQSPVFNGFLTWDTLGTDGPGAPPAGYIGDPGVEHAVTGSPTGNNFFRVERGTVNATGNFVPDGTVHAESDQFSVMGKISELSAVATPRGGVFDAPQQVTLTGSEPAGDIFYTLDGTNPTPDSTPYTGPIDISTNTNLKYIVVNEAGEQSEVFIQRYRVRVKVGLNVFKDQLSKGQRVGMGGIVSPSHEGFVRLRISRGGQRIATRRVPLGDNSRYRFVYRPPTIGNYRVRAIFPKQDRDHQRNFSTLERFKVTRP